MRRNRLVFILWAISILIIALGIISTASWSNDHLKSYQTAPFTAGFFVGLFSGMLLAVIGLSIGYFSGYILGRIASRKKRANITVDIEGTPVSIGHLTQQEAQNLAERFKSLDPKVTTKE